MCDASLSLGARVADLLPRIPDTDKARAIQKGTRVLISLWDSRMFGRVPGTRYPPEH